MSKTAYISPRVVAKVKGKNVDSRDLINATVIDKIEENDEFTMALNNENKKYKGAFTKSQEVEISFGYGNNMKKLISGSTDEIRYAGGKQGEVVTVMGTSINIADKAETTESFVWENTNVKEIGKKIARKLGLKLEDLTQILRLHSIQIKQKQQLQKSSLKFFHELAKEYGLEVQVKNGKIVVRDPVDKTAPEIIELEYKGGTGVFISYEQVERSKNIIKQLQATDYNEAEKMTMKVQLEGDSEWTKFANNTLQKVIPSVTVSDLKLKASADVKQINRSEKTANIVVVGHPKYRAGACIKLTNVIHDGIYYIREATHNYGRNQGYMCNLTLTNKRG